MIDALMQNKWFGPISIVVLIGAWLLHIGISVYRIHLIMSACDMRLNVRFEQRNNKVKLPKGVIIMQILMSLIMVGVTVFVLLY